MPLPKPRKSQSKKSFLESCLSDSTVNKEFPDTKQRYAVCLSQYERKRAKASYVVATANDEYIYETTDEEIEDNEAVSSAAKNEGKSLNKPFRLPKGSSKKFGVYVKNEKGNVVVVKFGDPNMEIKRDDPERRKSFRARHGCDNPGPKTGARYWSCLMWQSKPVSQITSSEEFDWDNLPEMDLDNSVPVVEEDES